MRRVTAGSVGALLIAGLSALFAGAVEPRQDAEYPIAKPGPEHEVLKDDVGVWEAEVKTFMPGSDEPMVSKGQETNRLLGGLWLVSDFRGEFGGQAFRGHGINGYDTQKKKYVGTWIDSMTSQMMIMEGTYDASKKTLTTAGEMYDPSTQQNCKVKNVATTNPDGTRTMAMFMESAAYGDKPFKMMEITYKKISDLPAPKGQLKKVEEKVKH